MILPILPSISMKFWPNQYISFKVVCIRSTKAWSPLKDSGRLQGPKSKIPPPGEQVKIIEHQKYLYNYLEHAAGKSLQ